MSTSQGAAIGSESLYLHRRQTAILQKEKKERRQQSLCQVPCCLSSTHMTWGGFVSLLRVCFRRQGKLRGTATVGDAQKYTATAFGFAELSRLAQWSPGYRIWVAAEGHSSDCFLLPPSHAGCGHAPVLNSGTPGRGRHSGRLKADILGRFVPFLIHV